MQTEFTLLSSHQTGDLLHDENEENERLLVWRKLETPGFQPSARIGHTSITVGYGAVVFGGVEAGQRVNSSVYLDVVNNSWSNLPCKGDLPPPRCFHAACAYDELMIIHGGEGPLDKVSKEPLRTASFEDSSVSTSASSVNDKIKSKPKYRSSQPLEGICPGDTIQPSFFGSGHVQTAQNNATLSGGNQKNDQSYGAPPIHCLDDLYALDCSTLTWVKVQCQLAPLPRKGHTINVCRVYGKRSLLVTGGYSLESAIVSNSILVCETEQVSKYVQEMVTRKRTKSFKSLSDAATASVVIMEETLRPAVWRSVQCRGPPPCGRYRHTTSIVSTEREELLVMIGGIGKDPSVSLNDVHILNLGSLTWIQIKELQENNVQSATTLNQLRGGEGPFMGVFGHVAFPVRKPVLSKSPADDSFNIRGSEDYEVMIFGGSSHPSDIGGHGYHQLFAFDLASHEWRRVLTASQFPSSRCFHSANFVPNWSPFHELPFESTSLQRNNSAGKNVSQLKRTNSMTTGLVSFINSAHDVADEEDFYLDLSAFYSDNNHNPETTGSIIIFGGVNISKAVGDAWVLDLQWREAGLGQFDDTMALRLKEQLKQTYSTREDDDDDEIPAHTLTKVPFSTSDLGNARSTPYIVAVNSAKYTGQSTMRSSASEPFLPNTSTSEVSTKANKMKLLQHLSSASNQQNYAEGGDDEGEDPSQLIMKIRKERALADMLVKEEREKLLAAEIRIKDLGLELESFRSKSETEALEKDAKIEKLQSLLDQALDREKKLKILNTEAYQLLALYGIQHL